MSTSTREVCGPVSALPGLQCELVNDFTRLEELSDDWERLCRGSVSEIFQQFAWTRAFWKACGLKFSVCSLVVHHGTEIVGILPLASRGETIRFLAEADYNDLICEERWAPTVLAASMEGLFQMSVHWRRCFLDNLRVDSVIVRHLPALPLSLRRKLDLVFACPCSTIVADQNGEVFAKLAQKRSLRRHQNKLQRRGRLTFRHVESRREIHQHLPSFFQQQIARRALLRQRSDFCNPETRAFHAALVDELDPRSELRFAVLELDGSPIAYHFGFQLNRKIIWYQPSFDIDFFDYSPGEVLIRKLLEYAQEVRLREFDFTIGGEMYKSRFANFSRQNFTLYLERDPGIIAGQFRHSMMRATRTARRIKEELKARPRLYSALKKKWLRASGFASQQRRLFRRAGLCPYTRRALIRILRNAIFAWDEALVFCFTAHPLPTPDSPHDPGLPLEIHPSSFSELALLSLEYPDEFPRSKLHVWRDRLAKGDKIRTLRSNGDMAHLAWTGTRSVVVIAELGEACQVPLSAPAMVLDGCWTAPGFRGLHMWSNALRLLVQEVGGKRDVWTYCVNPDGPAQREIEAAGFRLRNRVVQVRLLHALRCNWILRSQPN